MPFEIWVFLVAIGFYLYDSAILLNANELIISKFFSKYSINFPSDRLRFNKRIIYLPNPLTPFNHIRKISWSRSQSEEKIDNPVLPNNTYLRLSTFTIFYLMVLVFPVCIWETGLGNSSLLVLILIYLGIINILGYVYYKKNSFQITKREFLSIAFESLSCPPFALNILRKISLKNTASFEIINFAKQHLDNYSYEIFAIEFEKRTTEIFELADDVISTNNPKI